MGDDPSQDKQQKIINRKDKLWSGSRGGLRTFKLVQRCQWICVIELLFIRFDDDVPKIGGAANHPAYCLGEIGEPLCQHASIWASPFSVSINPNWLPFEEQWKTESRPCEGIKQIRFLPPKYILLPSGPPRKAKLGTALSAESKWRRLLVRISGLIIDFEGQSDRQRWQAENGVTSLGETGGCYELRGKMIDVKSHALSQHTLGHI